MLNVSDGEDEIEPADSASQVTNRSGITLDTLSVLKRSKLKGNKAELRSFEEMTKLKTPKVKLLAEAEERKAKLLAEAEERKLLAELEEKEALVRLRLESAHLKAEEKA